jgi:osmotically-inducible protein OsmY
MRTDTDIEKDIRAELNWVPDVDETDIAVNVRDRVVTLTGFARSLSEKFRAEEAAARIAGVAAVANDIEVRTVGEDAPPDPEIARHAVVALHQKLPISADKIQVLVDHGRVTLEGKVEWRYQSDSAASTVAGLPGVRHVENLIQIVPEIAPKDIQRRITDAFRRSAEVDASGITVTAQGSEVVLRGKVSSWSERMEAQRTAWSAPGVSHVVNEIAVVPPPNS